MLVHDLEQRNQDKPKATRAVVTAVNRLRQKVLICLLFTISHFYRSSVCNKTLSHFVEVLVLIFSFLSEREVVEQAPVAKWIRHWPPKRERV